MNWRLAEKNMAISFSFSSKKWRRCRIFSQNLLLGFASPPPLFFGVAKWRNFAKKKQNARTPDHPDIPEKKVLWSFYVCSVWMKIDGKKWPLTLLCL
jgi:hypothetical protein